MLENEFYFTPKEKYTIQKKKVKSGIHLFSNYKNLEGKKRFQNHHFFIGKQQNTLIAPNKNLKKYIRCVQRTTRRKALKKGKGHKK